MDRYIGWFSEIGIDDIPLVGGKNASLGEMHGFNDLTHLILGVDRDSEIVAPIFDERNPAVKKMIADVIAVCRAHGRIIQ